MAADKAALAVSAVELAISRRQVDPDQDQGLIHHSDQGSQGNSPAWRLAASCRRWGSASRWGRSVGDCFDHALIESFFATLECELTDQRHWHTRDQACLEVFWWIEAVYNRTRRHSRLGYLSPVDYEAMLRRAAATSEPSK